MELEKRVQALEQEIEILKNQIQTTLLDIQEQVLTNAYPSLRTGSDSHPNDLANNPHAEAPVVRTFSSNADQSSKNLSDETDMPIQVRRVSLEDMPQFQPDNDTPATPSLPDLERTMPAPAPQADWSRMEELEEWVSGKLDKVGPERTRDLIAMYCEHGRFDEETADALLSLVEVYRQESAPPFPNKSFDDFDQPSRRSAQPPSRPQPPQAPTAAGRARPTAASMKSQRRSDQPPVPPVHAAQAIPSQPTGRVPVTKPGTNGHSSASDDTEEAGEEKRSVILRLIAGVYNAGAGMKWGQDDG